jgi:transcriptional regulator with XRE-family HTH domain
VSPDTADLPPSPTVESEVERLATLIGARIRDRRRHMGWSIREVATRAGVANTTVQKVETGARGSLEMYVRLAEVLDATLEVDLRTRPTEGSRPIDAADETGSHLTAPTSHAGSGEGDLVHAVMGEQFIGLLAPHGFRCGVDEPWRQYQYAGRADVTAWDLLRRALLHAENRTGFPDIQDSVGRFNGKRAYLAASSWERMGMAGPPRVETHVMVALWSAEVLDAIRAYPGTFRAVCPDPPDAFLAWLAGKPPTTGVTSSLVLFDPFEMRARERFASLEVALRSAKPRVSGYAAAAEMLRARRPAR